MSFFKESDSLPDSGSEIHRNGAQNLKGATTFPCILVIQLLLQKEEDRENLFQFIEK